VNTIAVDKAANHPIAPATLVRVKADQPSFREVTFTPGFNVVLAERTKESTKKDSRNGLGKSTLIEIISFCLGGKAEKSGLGCEALMGWSFTLDIHLRGQPVSVTRSIRDSGKVFIDGDTTGWPIPPGKDRKSGRPALKVAEWIGVLANLMFGLPPGGFDTDYAPTFRSLISYFIRRGKDAYSIAFEHYRKQKDWDKQVNNAFLLDLAWEDASEWQKLRDKKAALDDLKKAQKSGLISEFMDGSLGELEALKVRLEAVVRNGAAGLLTFRVHEQYHELEESADRLSKEINATANRIVAERQLLGSYQAGLAEIPEPNIDDVIAVYEEAGVFFPSASRKQLEDVKEFHRKLIENRRRFLSSEITRLRQAIERNDGNQRRLDDERASVMAVLQSHGALDQFMQIQRVHAENVAHLRAIEAQIDTLRKIEEGKSNLRIEEELLRKKTRNDLDDRKTQRERAIQIFNGNSEVLYESPGNLVIDLGSGGFKYDIEIVRSRSGGFGNMKILCYDLMLAELWAGRRPSPLLLVHDSTLFADVDERQVAHGLELAEKKSRECGFQYICTMNSDSIPWKDFSPSFDFARYVRLTLTDKDPSGGLLGIRF
jgi:uncharacterized protein YydD (DUF2326 family)